MIFSRASIHIRSSNFRREMGFYLPVVFGIILVVVIISTQLGLFLSDYYQSMAVRMQQDKAFEIARKSLLAAERRLDTDSAHPAISGSLRDSSDGIVSIYDSEVWEDTLNSYDLTLVRDPVSSQTYEWWQQPESWWKKYTHELDNTQLSEEMLEDGRGFVAVEYVRKYDFDEDFSLRRNYSTGIYASVFRITAAGFTREGQRAVVTSLYVHTYAY